MSGFMRERKPGIWELRVSIGRDPVTGSPKALTKTFRGGKRAASDALAAFVTQVRGGSHLANGTATVSDLLKAYVDDREPTLSPSTVTLYRRGSARVAGTSLGRKLLTKTTPLDVDNAYRELREAGASEYTLRQIHRLLNSAFRQAVKWRQMTYNPAADARSPRLPRKRVEAPSVEDVRAVIDLIATRDPDLAGVLLLACISGLRRGALHGLQWGDIEGDQLVLRRSLTRVDRQIIERPPKMRAPGEVEVVALGAAELGVLARIRAAQDARRAAAGLGPVSKAGWVLSSDGIGEEPRRPDAINGKLWRACLELGIEPKISPHDLRHFAATQMVAAGIPIDTVARRLHHRDASITLAVYSHPTEADERRAGVAVAELLGT